MTKKFKLKDALHALHEKCRSLNPSTLVLVLAIILQLMPFGNLWAQDAPKHKVTGTIYSASDNSTLPGANVMVKGSKSGTVTDMNGKFSLEVNDNDVILVSFIGFLSEEIAVAGRISIDVKLIEDITTLNEIVKIGYGSVKRKDVTGAISSVKGEELLKTQPATFSQALQGKVAGVVVQQISGQPGGATSVQIRGVTGFSGSSPLYVVDGVMFEGKASLGAGTDPLAGINPSDIESTQVLMDASATAIYGSKGTDGVIIVTTKRGKPGPPIVTYDGYYGLQELPSTVDVMNLQEYATFINERSVVWGFDRREEFLNPKYLGKGTDWQDELFRAAPMQNHNVALSGGDERTNYHLSATYFDQEGIALGSEFNRLTVKLNLDNKTTKWLKLGTSLTVNNIDETVNSTSSNVIQTALSQTTDIPVKNADGSWGGRYNEDGWITNTPNPVGLASINKDEVNRKQFVGSLYADITFTKGLVLRNLMNGDFSMATQDRFNPSYQMGTVERDYNSGSYQFSQSQTTSISNVLDYTRSFADHYTVDAMIAHEASLSQNEGVSAYRENYPSNNVTVISAGDPTTAKNSGTAGHSARESFFGRASLSIKDKYVVKGTIRNDGNSMYAVDHRWATTYSGDFAWKINNESFLKNANNISELKLRVGYGLMNRPAGRNYAYASTLGTVPTGLSGVSQITQNIASPDLEWEQTQATNIGIDGSFFNWRLGFNFDVYVKNTDDLAMQTSLPWYSGTAIGWSPGKLDAPWVNVGSMVNKGFNLSVSSTNIQRANFTWKTVFTVSHNINEVVKLNTDGAPLMGQYSKTVEGRRIGDFYGYVVEGVYSSPIDFLGDPANGIEPAARPINSEGFMYPVGNASGSIWYGDKKYKDLNGDGVISPEDQTYIGSPMPKAQMGLDNTFTYKGFDLNIFFSASVGNKVFNQLRVAGESTRTSYGYLNNLKNYAKLGLYDPSVSASAVSNVYVINADTKIVGLRNDDTNGNSRFSDQYIEDGSYVKCKNILLGYKFPEKLFQRTPIGTLRVYANVVNAFVITKYSGMDPEIGSWDPLNAGVDYGIYPQSRVYTFGVNLSFNK